MQLSGLDYLAAAAAAGAAGAINALAGGGTLVSFPSLVALGVAPVNANVTNTVALVPGYLGGSWAQREELIPQLRRARTLGAIGAVGGLAGSVLLVTLPGNAFRAAVPYLILASSLLLLTQERLRRIVGAHDQALVNDSPDVLDGPAQLVGPAQSSSPPGVDAGSGTGAVAPGWPASTRREGGLKNRPALMILVFAGAVYGGFFGAGLGIVLLAILGIFGTKGLSASNALKQALSFVINLVAAVFFAFSGHVEWTLVPVMAAASICGGIAGGRLASEVSPDLLRRMVVATGVGVAVAFWVS